MRMPRALLGVILAVALAPVARASTVCDTYGDLSRFGMIGRTLFKAGLRGSYSCATGSNFDRRICTTKAKLAGFELEENNRTVDPASALVATQATGGAAIFSHPEAKNPCKLNTIEGDVITGGGNVISKGTPPNITGTTDTSGTHPLISSCTGAMLDAVDIANALHSAPAVMTIDKLNVPLGTTVTELTVPEGGGIVRIGSLTMAGVRSTVQYGYNYECLYAPGYNEAAWLEIIADEDDDIVLDVGELSIGNCAFILMPSHRFMINVAGTGRSVKIGVDSRGDYPINILAPERTVKITGEKGYELGTYLGFVWSNKLVMKGYTWPVSLGCDGND